MDLTIARRPRPELKARRQAPQGWGRGSADRRSDLVDTTDPVELAQAHRRLGYRAAYCPKADVKDTAAVRAIADAFRTEDVVIAEVGRWVNLLDRRRGETPRNLATVTEGLALAEAVGALCCVDIAGSFNPRRLVRSRIPTTSQTLLRCGRRERAHDHRRGQAGAGEVLLRDDGMVASPTAPPASCSMLRRSIAPPSASIWIPATW